MSKDEKSETYLVPNEIGGWDEVTYPDPRLGDLGNALRQLKTRLQVEQVPLQDQFAHKAYASVGVSRYFFQLTKQTFRGLRRHADRWQFLEYLLFHAIPDERYRLIPVPQNLLAAIENKKPNHYEARRFLLRFQRDVMSPDTFQFSEGWDSKSHQCRMVTKLILPADYEEALKVEKARGKKEVFFCGGHRWSERKAIQMVSRKRKEQEVRDAKWISASAKEVIDYMNTSDPRPFAAVICRNFAAAVEAVNKLPPDKRRRELIILEAIKKDPKPYYGPSRSRKTPRIFARGRNSIPQLQKTIRKVLTKGWYEADLKSVQLAINAVLWGAEQTRRFLEDDGNVWETLFDYLQIPPDKKDIAKGAFKTTIYAIWFDRDAQLVGPILSRVLSRLGAETEGNAIYSIPMIREMLQEREHAKARIAHDGGVTDCNGRWIKLGKGRDAASLMAEAAQVAEMELLLPAIRLAKTTDEFQITLYQHDGFSVFFRRNKEQWRESIDKEVNKKAKEMGFPTGLDWEEL